MSLDFIIKTYHDAPSSECQLLYLLQLLVYKHCAHFTVFCTEYSPTAVGVAGNFML